MKFFFNVSLLILCFNLFAHEGAHGPAQKMAPHGGSLVDGKFLMAELVPDEQGVKIYFLTHESKPIPSGELKISQGTISLMDSKKKKVSVQVLTEKDYISIKFDKTKSYRFNLLVPVGYRGNQETLTWGFEPQDN